MEPMTLGSPVGSPSSPGGSAFLPKFLMGEPTHNPHPSSPTKTPRQINISSMSATPRSLNLNTVSPSSERRTRSVHVTQVEKPGGPPTRGLFDTLESVNVPVPANVSYNNFNEPCTSPLASIQNIDDTATVDNWVTVFGFTPAAASSILNQFSQLGQLLEHKFPPKGNWVHLHYYSKMEARRALTYHGKIVGGTTMIGVIPCRDQDILKNCKAPQTPVFSPPPSNRRLSPNRDPCSPWTPNASLLHSPRARPLTRSFISDNDVLSQKGTPIRSSSIVTRTIDYIFGW